MRKIIGTIGATLAIAIVMATSTGLAGLTLPNNVPLGDGVDQAASEPQEPPTMTLQEALELASFTLQVPEGEVTRDGRRVSGRLAEFPASADEQRNQFV
jgi:hypothetical protein